MRLLMLLLHVSNTLRTVQQSIHIINRKHKDIHSLLYCTIRPFHISWLSNIDHRSSTNDQRTSNTDHHHHHHHHILPPTAIFKSLTIQSIRFTYPGFRTSIIDHRPTNIEHRSSSSSSSSSYITSYCDL